MLHAARFWCELWALKLVGKYKPRFNFTKVCYKIDFKTVIKLISETGKIYI